MGAVVVDEEPEPFATIDVVTGEVLAGHLPAPALRAIRALLDAHRPGSS